MSARGISSAIGRATKALPSRSAEQKSAFAELHRLIDVHRLRVRADSEGFPIIPGRYGRIEWFDGQEWAVYSDHQRVFEKLWAIPGVRRWQTADEEMRAVFPPEALEQVAGVIRARRRRTLSSAEARRRSGLKPTHRATSGL
jgi:hypothetical protein